VKEVVIRSLDDLVKIFGELKTVPFPFLLQVTEKLSRSHQQNKLMWRWANDIASQTGYSADEVQARWKAKFGIPILSESEKYRALYERIPWRDGSNEEIIRMLEYLPVTSHMTVAQMTLLLGRVEAFHTLAGHKLTDPEELSW
jgi:hypothetical protein